MDRYTEGYYDGQLSGTSYETSHKQSTENFKKLLKLIGIFLFGCLLYSSSLVSAYYIVKEWNYFQHATRWEKLACIAVAAYIITCVLFLIKGVMIALKTKGKSVWYLLWVVCFTYVCLLPMIAIYFFLEMSLAPTPAGHGGIQHYQLWSAAGALLAGGIIYSRYDLGRDNSLPITAWAYQSGLRLGLSIVSR